MYFIEDLERTSDDSCDTVLDGHDIGRTTLEHGHIWRSLGHRGQEAEMEPWAHQHRCRRGPWQCRDLSFSLRMKNVYLQTDKNLPDVQAPTTTTFFPS
jgi:hypothetical protein